MNLLLTVLLHKTLFTASTTRFLAFSIDFWTWSLAYLEATNSAILLRHSNILKTTSYTVMNLLLTVLLHKTRFIASKTWFFGFLIDFRLQDLAYLEATNSGILLRNSNILKTMLYTVVNLWLTVFRNKNAFTASKILIICDFKKLHNPGVTRYRQ